MMSRCEYNAALSPSQEMELITVYKDRDLKCPSGHYNKNSIVLNWGILDKAWLNFSSVLPE